MSLRAVAALLALGSAFAFAFGYQLDNVNAGSRDTAYMTAQAFQPAARHIKEEEGGEGRSGAKRAAWHRVQRDLCPGFVQNPKEEHVFEKDYGDHCKGRQFMSWTQENTRAACRVRMVLVELNTDLQYEYTPAVVEVGRCLGSTSPCLGVNKTNRSVQVFRRHLNGEEECGRVAVEEHGSCEIEK